MSAHDELADLREREKALVEERDGWEANFDSASKLLLAKADEAASLRSDLERVRGERDALTTLIQSEHREVTAEEHAPWFGAHRAHGNCIRCGEAFPCKYAALAPAVQQEEQSDEH